MKRPDPEKQNIKGKIKSIHNQFIVKPEMSKSLIKVDDLI